MTATQVRRLGDVRQENMRRLAQERVLASQQATEDLSPEDPKESGSEEEDEHSGGSEEEDDTLLSNLVSGHETQPQQHDETAQAEISSRGGKQGDLKRRAQQRLRENQEANQNLLPSTKPKTNKKGNTKRKRQDEKQKEKEYESEQAKKARMLAKKNSGKKNTK